MGFDVSVNLWAVLVSAVASMVIGSVWYGPLFGKKFIALMGMDKLTPEEMVKMQKGMWKTYVMQIVSSILCFYVLAWFIEVLEALTLMGGLEVAFLVWLGFVVPIKFGDAIWGGRSCGLLIAEGGL
jgi:hypothetical protein